MTESDHALIVRILHLLKQSLSKMFYCISDYNGKNARFHLNHSLPQQSLRFSGMLLLRRKVAREPQTSTSFFQMVLLPYRWTQPAPPVSLHLAFAREP